MACMSLAGRTRHGGTFVASLALVAATAAFGAGPFGTAAAAATRDNATSRLSFAVDGEAILIIAAVLLGCLALFALLSVRLLTRHLRQQTVELRQSEARHRRILDQMIDTYYRSDADGRVVMASPSVQDLLGYTVDEVLGTEIASHYVDPQGRDRFLAALQESGGQVKDFCAEIRTKDGGSVFVATNSRALYDEKGEFLGVEGTIRDVTDRIRSEQALRESEERLRQATTLAGLGYWIWDVADERCVYSSEEQARIHGMSVEEYLERASSVEGELDLIHPDDRNSVRDRFRSLRQGQGYDIEFRIVTPEGEVRHIREVAVPVFDETGTVVKEHGTILDVTGLRLAEERLVQVRKMEAVGRLTGGIAHDFNNLLAVVLGNAELLEDRLPPGDDSLKAIQRAGGLGAELTQRLLTFSRRQSLRPKPIDMNTLISSTSALLSRTLGETITVATSAAPDLWRPLADPSEMENALVNLALNARDAMPDGGRLSITCENLRLAEGPATLKMEVAAGDYIVVSVSDTGTGMSPEVHAQAFEPFFTTKEVGEGSGLGLSTVYGFAKQSGGHASIHSEPGRGTTVKLLLPRAAEQPQKETAGRKSDPPVGRGERILVIEDNDDVRGLTVRLLEGLGYRPTQLPDAAGARKLLEDDAIFDLVLSDVVLPGGTSGPEFAEEACRLRPGLRFVFMSGYPATAGKGDGALHSDQTLLAKPFRRHQLACTLHSALHSNGP